MKKFKRVCAVILCIMMVIPTMAFSASAAESPWIFLGGKFSSNATTIIFDGDKVRDTGFTFTENENGGIDVHSPSYEEAAGVYGVSLLSNKNKTTLDNLSVVITPGDTFDATRDSFGFSDRLSIMFSENAVTELSRKEEGTGSYIGLYNYEMVGTNGIRHLMPKEGNSLVVSVNNTYDGYDGQIFSDVAIVKGDGEFEDYNDHRPGYRWVFTGETVGDKVTSEFLRVDVSRGLVFEIIPDTTLGFKVSVNGNEYFSGKSIKYFPIDVDNSFVKKRADIDLSNLVGVQGYLAIGSCAAFKNALDYTVEKINGYDAATWAGEAPAEHTHSFNVTEKEVECLSDGIEYVECECGQHYIRKNTKQTGHIWATNKDPIFRDWGYSFTDTYWSENITNTFRTYTFVEYPTCTETGLNHKVCSVCGESEDDILPARNHQAFYIKKDDKQNGKNKIYYANRWGDWEITTPATATTKGVKTRTCFMCGATETMEYSKWDDQEDINDKWYVSGETTISRSNGNLTGKVIYTAVNTDGKRVKTVVGEDGSISLLDAAAQTGVLDATTSYNNITKITSRNQSDLNGFSATVQMIPVNGKYADSINFIWTNKYDNYKYAGQYSAGSFSKSQGSTIEDSRFGYLWDYYIPGEEYSFVVTLMDGLNLWDQYFYGTMNDNIYDVAFYGSICRGNLWNVKYSETGINLETYDNEKIAIDASEPISVQTNYCYDEDECVPDILSFDLNGLRVFALEMNASQSYEKIYHFSTCGFAAGAGSKTSSFKLIDVCGQRAKDFVSFENTEDCEHEWGEYVWNTKVVIRDGKYTIINDEPDCITEGSKISTCSKCEATRKLIIPAKGHDFGNDDIIKSPTCTSDGIGMHYCKVWFLSDKGINTPCSDIEYFLIKSKGHKFGEWEIVEEATDDKDGLKKRTCEICLEVEEEKIPALNPVIENPFKDLPKGKWYTDPALWCYAKGYLTGLSDTVFGPDNKLTRAQFVQILAKVSNADLDSIEYKDTFKDVPEGKWYTNAVLWASENGVTSGLGNGLFGTANYVTREQLATFLYSYSKKAGCDVDAKADITDYEDYSSVSTWARDSLAWAVNAKLIASTSTEAKILSPKNIATRGQAAVIIKALCLNVLK